MARLIDTTVFIEIERKGQSVRDIARAAAGEPIALSSVTAAELLRGVTLADAGRRRERRASFLEVVFAQLLVVPFDLLAAREYARLSAYLERTGRRIAQDDGMIAATALAHGFALLTHNVRHFDRVPGLELHVARW